MEFSSIWYFSFWSLVSLVFSETGSYALRKATIPISDLVKFHFEIFISSSVIISTSHAFLFRPGLEHDRGINAARRCEFFFRFHLDLYIVYLPIMFFSAVSSAHFTNLEQKFIEVTSLVLFVCITPNVVKSIRKRFKYSQTIGNLRTAFAGPLVMYPNHTVCWLLSIIFASYVIPPGLGDYHLQSIFSCVSTLCTCSIYGFYFSKLTTTSTMAAQTYGHQKIIEIVFGILGTTLAQYYFRVKSTFLMLGYLSLAFAWLGILANFQPQTDFGIFQFLVTASLECAVSLFGLHFYTFLVACGGIALTILRWKMKFVSLRYFGLREEVMRDWKRLEELYGNDSNDSSIQTHDLEQPHEGASNAQRPGIQRRLTQQFKRLWSPHAPFRA